MPVRIYDISKKLGLTSKDVIAMAKELGIVGARVASSSLDKITAEYLEDKLKDAHPLQIAKQFAKIFKLFFYRTDVLICPFFKVAISMRRAHICKRVWATPANWY